MLNSIFISQYDTEVIIDAAEGDVLQRMVWAVIVAVIPG